MPCIFFFFILGSIYKLYLSLKERDASIDESHDHPHRSLCCPLLQADGAPEAEKIDGKDKAGIYFVIWVSESYIIVFFATVTKWHKVVIGGTYVLLFLLRYGGDMKEK